MLVFSNTAMSADGKIGTFRHDHVAIGSKEDLRGMSRLRAQADAVIVGGKTFRNWPLPLVENPTHLDNPPVRERPVLNVVLTRRGILEAEHHRFPSPRVELLVLGPPELEAEAHRERFGCEVETTGAPDLAWALSRIAARGCQRVLIEGGGELIFEAVNADLLDELHLTICPKLIGGRSAPTPLDGAGFPADTIRTMRLLDLRRVGDELFLHYSLRPQP